MDIKITWLFTIVMMCSSLYNHHVDATQKSSRKYLEKQLKFLKKPPIKTFENNVGDVIDCIPIHKQPAFDHPLLKNHRIEMEPGSLPDDHATMSSNTKDGPIEIEFTGEECPIGTVPIQRTRKEDLKERLMLNESSPFPNLNTNNHVVMLRTRATVGAQYFGAGARISVYGLDHYVNNGQSSSANIWLQSGFENQDFNLIAAGHMVSQALNGDTYTRLFTSWLGNKGVKGCYNTLCPGFVQVDRLVTPNAIIRPTSTYGGQQYEIKITVFKDPKTEHWWFLVGDHKVGYWPKEIFSRMYENAQLVAFGGAVTPDQNGLFPPMGNGHRPDGNFRHSAYLRQVSYRDVNAQLILPGLDDLEEKVVHSNCYSLVNNKDHGPWRPDYSFFFGGPGGLCLN